MKIRMLIVTGIGLIAFHLPNAWGVLPPKQAALPNFDKRNVTAQAVSPDAGQQEAEALLKNRVPGLQITRDRILGTPRLITAVDGFLSGPGGRGKALQVSAGFAAPANDSQATIKAFLNEHAAVFGHNADALASARVKRDYVTAHNGLHTVIWEQTLDDIPVFDGLMIGHTARNGELVSISSHFVPDAARAANVGTPGRATLTSSPLISVAEAVARAASNLGADLNVDALIPVSQPQGAEKNQKFKSDRLRGEARAHLVWFALNKDSMRLCWRVQLTVRSRGELYSVLVDAETGEVVVRRCLTNYITDATYNVFTSESPAPMLPGLSIPGTTQAALTNRQLVTLSALSTNASPNGWINDGDTETKGNNVDAHTDLNSDDLPDLPRPSATNRVFDFPIDFTQSPGTYREAAVVQLFYWCNWYHDRLYDLGFTEAAGNFQDDNFGRGGAGGDAVQADAQDGSGVDNANFSTPADGEPGRMQMYVFIDPEPDRDGDLDATVILHEHTHGLSNRLVGGGVGIFELQPAGMGEGWSDFYGMSLVAPAGADPHANYPEGAYLTYQLGGLRQNYYYGIRRYPYSTDKFINPLTFKDIDPSQADPHPGVPISPIFGGAPADEVHDQGEVWCVTLWGARANLTDKLGYDDGNRMILQLVTDGMKLSPPNPTFIEARDAIIQADEIDTGGDNRNELWLAFADRGMGFSARAPSSDTTVGVVEAFDLPDDVIISPADGIMEISVTPPSRSALFASSSEPIFVRVTDGGAVTNATITATVSGVGNLVFRNNGAAPDITANNSVYSALFNVPTNAGSVTMTLVIAAPGKETSTNIIEYTIIPLPSNDNFANSIKVPPSGAVYVSNNKFATKETGEPDHAGVSTADASLWWTWSSGVTTNVLVDTGSSLFDTVIGVYTGSQVNALTQVASANDIGKRRQAFLTFTAQAGASYKIAVASTTSSGTGTLNLRVAPGGLPDTSAPVVTISSPLNGFIFTTNRIVVTGSAVDPQPNPSGINQILIRTTSSEHPTEGSEIVVTNATASIVESTNWTQIVALTEGQNTIRVTATDIAGNVSAPATLRVTYQRRDPVNDLFNNAIELAGNSGVSSVNSLSATKELGEPLHAGNAGGKSVWWTFTPPSDGVLTLTTTNSTFDTLLAMYVGTRANSLTPVASNDDAYDGVSFSKITQSVRANQLYRIAVDGFDGSSGIVYLSYDFAPSTIYHLTVSTIGSGGVTPSSGDYAGGSTVVLNAAPDPNYQFVDWEGSVTSSANPLSVVINGDMTLTARFSPHVFTDGFESGGLTALPWTSGGDKPWVVQSNLVSFGQFAARSGSLTNSQSSSLNLVFNSGGGVGSFDYKVSSETNWDWLEFRVNGSLLQRWSGEAGWTTYQFPMPAGSVTLEWRYVKDPNQSAGLDAAFIDNVDLPSTPPSLRLLNPTVGSFQIQFQGPSAQQVRIQASPDLTTWQTISTNVINSGATIQFTDPQAPGLQLRFYRAISP